MISEKRLKEIKDLVSNASAGPWKYDCGNLQVEHDETRYTIANIENTLGCRIRHWKRENKPGLPPHYDSDGEFIAESRQIIPDLIAEIERLKEIEFMYQGLCK